MIYSVVDSNLIGGFMALKDICPFFFWGEFDAILLHKSRIFTKFAYKLCVQ